MQSAIDAPAPSGRPLGMRLIIAYKFVKGPAVLALAAALTFARTPADHLLRHLVAELSEWGLLGWRLAHWLEPWLTPGVEVRAAILSWLDGLSTVTEGFLLLWGKAWGEWLVVAGLSLLMPLEVMGLFRRPSITRAIVLLVNALVVAYLVRRRLTAPRSA
jgi:hypothetical protein